MGYNVTKESCVEPENKASGWQFSRTIVMAVARLVGLALAL